MIGSGPGGVMKYQILKKKLLKSQGMAEFLGKTWKTHRVIDLDPGAVWKSDGKNITVILALTEKG